MKNFLLACICCLLSLTAIHAQSNQQEEQILKVMHQQQVDWNNGDLPAFMESYWKNDSLAFVGSKKITYGWKQTLQNYKESYPGKAGMGTLNFSDIQVTTLSPTSAFVIGAWHLTREMGNLDGHYTLLFRKIDGRWVITVDHSS